MQTYRVILVRQSGERVIQRGLTLRKAKQLTSYLKAAWAAPEAEIKVRREPKAKPAASA